MKFGLSWPSGIQTHTYIYHKITQLYMSLLNTRAQQMRVVPNEKVFGSVLNGFLHVCIHLKVK